MASARPTRRRPSSSRPGSRRESAGESDKALRGWLREQKAAYLHLTDPVAAQQALAGALADNTFVLRSAAAARDRSPGATWGPVPARSSPTGPYPPTPRQHALAPPRRPPPRPPAPPADAPVSPALPEVPARPPRRPPARPAPPARPRRATHRRPCRG
ncbi:conserved hypothetical protein [Streptomyces griseoflavus Tu4000]|uniref:Uncharacterized protein n=1 Tax=Streptomyces griseoflavus Tu4000 TaxID=467200 RepID=D9Y290_9ACTN|nr:conserved hypothetical protein [Streptomyces griseoflavus Tu4000]